MKIWCQGLFPSGQWKNHYKYLIEYLNSIADPGTEVQLHGVGIGGGAGLGFRFGQLLMARTVLENALKAESSGFDAFTLVNTADAALDETREMVNIPVVGILQTALLVASTMGSRFALLVPNERAKYRFEEIVERYGFKDRLAGIESIQFEYGDLGPILLEPAYKERLMQQMVEGSRKVREAGADVLIPTGAIVIMSLIKTGINQVENIPVFNSIAAVIKMTEMVVKLRQITGQFISRKQKYASPTEEVLREVGKAYGIM